MEDEPVTLRSAERFLSDIYLADCCLLDPYEPFIQVWYQIIQ